MNTTYSEHQYEMAYPPGIEHHWWTLARNRLIERIVLAESANTSSFLEVGCGKGVVVKSLRDSGLEIRGVELADVKPIGGADQWVETGTDACELPADTRVGISGILLLDVIEHLPDPGVFLRRLQQSFSNLSVVIVTVPTCQELWSNYDSFAGHYRRYTLNTLTALGDELGWKMADAGYFFRFSYLPMRLMTWLGIDRNLRISAPGKGMRPIHRLISQACILEQSTLPALIRGSSAYAVFHTRTTVRG